MRLNIRESGDGEKIAVLIHGFNCDSGDWWELTPILVSRGYRVQALDLRGHGDSRRADSYTIAEFAADVVETVTARPDLIIGHSLGARVTGEVVESLRPTRAVYLDPPWSTTVPDEEREALFPPLDQVPLMSDEELATRLRNDFPAWSERAIEVDLASWRKWDPATADFISGAIFGAMPGRAVVPSLLVVADRSVVCNEDAQSEAARRGFEVREASGLSHSLFRDDFDVFMRSVDDWL